jgi:hypothetical protein
MGECCHASQGVWAHRNVDETLIAQYDLSDKLRRRLGERSNPSSYSGRRGERIAV